MTVLQLRASLCAFCRKSNASDISARLTAVSPCEHGRDEGSNSVGPEIAGSRHCLVRRQRSLNRWRPRPGHFFARPMQAQPTALHPALTSYAARNIPTALSTTRPMRSGEGGGAD